MLQTFVQNEKLRTMNNLYIMNLAIADFLIGMAKGSNWDQPSSDPVWPITCFGPWLIFGLGFQFGASFNEFLYSLFGLWKMDFWEIYMWWNELKRFLKLVLALKLGFYGVHKTKAEENKNERSFNRRSRHKQRFWEIGHRWQIGLRGLTGGSLDGKIGRSFLIDR